MTSSCKNPQHPSWRGTAGDETIHRSKVFTSRENSHPFQKITKCLLISFSCAWLTSCGLLDEVQKGTNAIQENREVVESTTRAISANRAAIQQSTHAVLENKDIIASSNDAIRENQAIVASGNKAIDENRRIVEKTNLAIKQNEELINQSVAAIKQNVAAVEASTVAIKKNGEAIQEATQLLGQMKISPGMAHFLMFVVFIILILTPILMIIFMWKINHNMETLLARLDSKR